MFEKMFQDSPSEEWEIEELLEGIEALAPRVSGWGRRGVRQQLKPQRPRDSGPLGMRAQIDSEIPCLLSSARHGKIQDHQPKDGVGLGRWIGLFENSDR